MFSEYTCRLSIDLDCFTPSNVRESRRVFARTTILAKFEMPPTFRRYWRIWFDGAS